VGLVEDGLFFIHLSRRVPEFTKEPRSLLVIPNIERDRAAVTRDAAEFFQSVARVWDLVQAQAAHCDVETGVSEREGHGIRGFESDVRARAMFPSEVYLFRRNIHSDDAGGRIVFDNSFGDDATAAANVDPSQTLGKVQPLQELLRKQAAPTAHPSVVVRAGSPAINIGRFHVQRLEARNGGAEATSIPHLFIEIGRLFRDAVLFVLGAQNAINGIGSSVARFVVVADLHLSQQPDGEQIQSAEQQA
jgi:hypothetical protein